MHSLTFVVALLVGLTVPRAVCAQVPAPLDSVQRAAMMASAMQASKPAEFVLRHRSDLALSPVQVTALEALVLAQRDSTVSREKRLVARMQANPPSAAAVAAWSWSGNLDEEALRDALSKQLANQLELMMGFARDRWAAAALLTPAQVAQLPGLEAKDLMRAIKRP